MEITSAFNCNPNSGYNHEMSAHKGGQADHGSKRDGKEPLGLAQLLPSQVPHMPSVTS